MIDRALVFGYKSLQNCEIELKNGLNIIVGNNKVGKSSLLEAINFEMPPFLIPV
ncbi:AAA family ATPase [Leptospira mayottensis]|uniref:AAA family ATPase n=1 Tax=Leptospira mayottensis TaxID=1137606 RepID=UPI000E35B0F9|nr:AAA family ATPase [Leptospira mayottensis]AXR67835.1 hypothetical protein DPV73_07200 [Leptospira mayottensis]